MAVQIHYKILKFARKDRFRYKEFISTVRIQFYFLRANHLNAIKYWLMYIGSLLNPHSVLRFSSTAIKTLHFIVLIRTENRTIQPF